MLKLKDNVTFEQLEKLGFRLSKEQDCAEIQGVMNIELCHLREIDPTCTHSSKYFEIYENKLFDLINLGYVEKFEEK